MRPRNKHELSLIRQSGKITALALKKALKKIKVGVTALELDKEIEAEIKRLGGELSFTTVSGYKWASCITFNEQVVHGIPTDRKIKEGDIISIDLGTLYKGWHSDAAWTVEVNNKKNNFLKIGEEALWKAIAKAVEGNRIGDISSVIQQEVEGEGYAVVRSLVGHGVGKQLHEDPEIPGVGKAGKGMELKKGMTLAIEVIYTKGKPDVVLSPDNWTVSSADGSMSALFEMTVVVGKEKAEVLTMV